MFKYNKRIKNHLSQLIVSTVFIFQLIYVFLFPLAIKAPAQAALSLVNASDTLTNSRLSFQAGVATGASAGATQLTIDAAGQPDILTNHLFPKDSVCFAGYTKVGCSDWKNFTVGSILNTTSFSFTPQLISALGEADLVVASASARHTIAFTTTGVGDVTGGKIQVKIPSATSGYNDGMPDQTGFDAALITNDNINTYIQSTSGFTKTGTTWSYAAGYHIITISFSGTITDGSTVSFIIGDSADTKYQFVNPSAASGHVSGTADIYSVPIELQSATSLPVGISTLKVAPVEGVLVSATIEQTLNFKVCGVAADRTAVSPCTYTAATPANICGATTLSAASTPYSVPFGSIANADTFYNVAQYLQVSTNGNSGYIVTIEENDQMGLSGKACTGATADDTIDCIKDTVCDNTCTQAAVGTWKTATYSGLGYSLHNLSNTDAAFLYTDATGNCSTNTNPFFCAKQVADQEVPETKATIMCGGGTTCASNGPKANSSLFVCYRLAVSGTQPAGYYYNKIKYVATASF